MINYPPASEPTVWVDSASIGITQRFTDDLRRITLVGQHFCCDTALIDIVSDAGLELGVQIPSKVVRDIRRQPRSQASRPTANDGQAALRPTGLWRRIAR